MFLMQFLIDMDSVEISDLNVTTSLISCNLYLLCSFKQSDWMIIVINALNKCINFVIGGCMLDPLAMGGEGWKRKEF